MSCKGCSGAVERALKKAETEGVSNDWCMSAKMLIGLGREGLGVNSYEVNLENQSVLVKGSIPYDTLLERIKKTGKEVRVLVLGQVPAHNKLKCRSALVRLWRDRSSFPCMATRL